MNQKPDIMKPEIGDIVFFLNELSLKTGIVVGITHECNKDNIDYICPQTAVKSSYIVFEINLDKTIREYTKTTLLENELLTLEEAISELKDRFNRFAIAK